MQKIKVKPSVVEKVWVTEAGFKAAVVLMRGSHRCGYVAVPVGHPLHGLDYSTATPYLQEIPEDEPVGDRSALTVLLACGREDMRSMDIVFDVHGGVTWANKFVIKEGTEDSPFKDLATDEWWIGFDCAHCGDGKYPYEFEDGSILESTVSHDPVRSQEYVEMHCESLAQQIKDKTLPMLAIEDKRDEQ